MILRGKEESLTITPELDLFARKITSYLGKNPDVSNDVEIKLAVAREMAVAKMKPDMSVVTETEKETVANWFKKHYASFSNNIVALAILVAAVPLGMNVVNFEHTTTFKSNIVSADISEDFYLENVYHLEADSFDEDYLKEMGFI